jgi:hypothetical protein
LKNENGAKFGTPLAEMVETNAIGRGNTHDSNVLKLSRRSRSAVTRAVNSV